MFKDSQKRGSRIPNIIELRDVSQLAENRERIYVGQGLAAISTHGEELQSEGFSQCSALIIQGNNEAYLAHIDKWDLSDQQYTMLDQLPPGDYVMTMITGSLSRVGSKTLANREITNFLQRLIANGRRVEIRNDIQINSGDSHWWISYNSSEHKAQVLIRTKKQIQTFLLN